MNEIPGFVRGAKQRFELAVRVDHEYHSGMSDRVILGITRCFLEVDAEAFSQLE